MRGWIGVVAAAMVLAEQAAADPLPARIVVMPFDVRSAAGESHDDTRQALEDVARQALMNASESGSLYVLSDRQTRQVFDAQKLSPDKCFQPLCRGAIARAARADAVLIGRVYEGPRVVAQLQLFVMVTGETFTGDTVSVDSPAALPGAIAGSIHDLLAQHGEEALDIPFTTLVEEQRDTYGWGALTASIEPAGSDVISFEAGSPQDMVPGAAVGITHGLSHWFDVGVRLTGELGAPSLLRVPLRMRIVQGRVFALTLHFDPGAYWNLNPDTVQNLNPTNTLPAEGFYFDSGLQFGFRMTPRAELGFGFDGQFWNGGGNPFALLTYTSFEYVVTRRVSVGVKTGVGLDEATATGDGVNFDLVAELTFGLRL